MAQGNPARKRLSLRSTTLLAAVFGILIVGSAYLKARHLRQVAHDLHALGPAFELPRAGFSRDGTLGDASCSDEAARTLLLQGMADYAHGRDAQAQRALLKCVAKAPEWARARFYLGVVRLQLGFPTSAAEDLRRARNAGFQPEDDSSAWWLGVAELYCGRTDSGRQLLLEDEATGSMRAGSSREILNRLENLERDNE